ncbi:MAG: glycosyltransferase family 4 protein [Acetobacteraceae bacterium]|nr:glycosyltransferase family 4 protein [Acetobacteraceae bacterium]MBV8578970.1 glycosyltransferase family 4 protein [Acetobacteraceae bacterium]
MRIAQIAPLFEAVPPKLYGGTERIVSYLTEELVALGHDVTLFASADSVTTARLEPVWPRAIRLDPGVRDWIAAYARMIELVYRHAGAFDVIHFHIDYFPFSLFSRQVTPHVTTLHGRLDLPEFAQIYNLFPHVPVVSISDAQRRPMPRLGWARTVHHGVPDTLLTPQDVNQEYFAFLGRVSPEKGLDKAIRIAAQCGARLKVAAKVDKADQDYFDQIIKPLLAHGHVEFIGEIGEADKPGFLSGAQALLFPIDWPEPFGLVMIEAMACGTPVVAFNRGSVPEVVEDGLTGFVVEDEAGAVAAAQKLGSLNREQVRARFEDRWTARRMAEDYVSVYAKLRQSGTPQLRAVGD